MQDSVTRSHHDALLINAKHHRGSSAIATDDTIDLGVSSAPMATATLFADGAVMQSEASYAIADDSPPTQGLLAGFVTGDTVLSISTDGQTFSPVNGSDDSFQNTTTIDGPYLTYAVNADGTMQISANPADQPVVDEIQSNGANATPLSDSLFYQIADSNGLTTTYEVTYALNDVIVATSGAPYTVPETVAPSRTVSIAGISVDKALASGQGSDQNEALSVTISLVDKVTGNPDGMLSIDPAMTGGAGNSGETISYGANDGSVTISGTIAQIDADLQGLSYQSPAAGNDEVQLQATDGPSTTAVYNLGTLLTVTAVTQQDTYGYGVFPGLYSLGGVLGGFQAGDTVTAVSLDGVSYLPVVGSDDTFQNSTTIDGTYLDYSFNADGSEQGAIASDSQTLINEINANQGASTPLSDTIYYVIEDSAGNFTTVESTAQFNDVLINTRGAPYSTPEIVAPFSSTNIAGLSVDKALSTGQTGDAGENLVVTVSLFDFTNQKADGTLTIDPAVLGSGAGGTIASSANGSAITLSGTIAQIDADLQGLTYTSPAASNDAIEIQAVDGPATTSEYIVGQIETCYCAGTAILTPAGEVMIEDLSVGDAVVTRDGGTPLIRWIGFRCVQFSARHNSRASLPIRIRADAFSLGVPHRDLLVTQEHCIFQDGVLVPARMLVNGRSILIDETIEAYTYYHIELERHAIIFAEGLTSESYLDTGNRGRFENAASPASEVLFTVDPAHRSWADAAAPLAVDRATVEPIWRRLDARAQAAGLPAITRATITEHADLHLRDAAGRIMPLLRVRRHRHAFRIPAGSNGLSICSRRFVPAETIGPFLDDRRTLGVKVGEIVVHRGFRSQSLTRHLTDAALPGWAGLEDSGQRWTTGAAALTLDPTDFVEDDLVLEIEVVAGGPWPDAAQQPA